MNRTDISNHHLVPKQRADDRRGDGLDLNKQMKKAGGGNIARCSANNSSTDTVG